MFSAVGFEAWWTGVGVGGVIGGCGIIDWGLGLVWVRAGGLSNIAYGSERCCGVYLEIEVGICLG